MLKEIIITAREKQGKISGQKYLAFTAVKKDGQRVAIKFRKEVEGLPKKAGRYVFEIESTSMNSRMTDYGEEWWVSANPVSVKDYIPEDTAKDQF